MYLFGYTLEELNRKRKEEMIKFDYDNPEECLAAVRQDGYALKYVKEQTEEICLEAIKQNGYALRYVKDLSILEDIDL